MRVGYKAVKYQKMLEETNNNTGKTNFHQS